MNSRQQEEMKMLKKNHFFSVRQLSAHFGVSEMTIRRDIQYLDQQHLAKQVFGGITESDVDNIKNYDHMTEKTKHSPQKDAIAKVAASLIHNGDVIFMDSGSTIQRIPDYIPEDMECTFITSSLPAINNLRRLTKSAIIVCGGRYSQKSNSFLNNSHKLEFDEYRAMIAFIGVTGFDKELGLTCSYIEEKAYKQSLIKNSMKRIIVTDSSKFAKVSTACFADISQFNIVITDKGISNEYKDYLESQDIQLLIADQDL
ncbi:MAG: DeoR/GlpR family DNA-binding transcription regulator [Spirochaetia bacterium]|nr:DeoR/GlpR family DNA-binding transcription regulator [Spirochaetia bacterium]